MWVLVICEAPTHLGTLSRIRQVLGLPLSEVAELRRRLPGVFRTGPRDIMEGMAINLERNGLRAAAFPAWQLDDPPSEDQPDLISDEEYEIFTAVCHTDLLRFELPDMTFCDLLGEDEHLRRPTPERFSGPLRYRLLKNPEILADYERRNAEGGRLRKRFRSPGSYHLQSERRKADLCGGDGGVVSLTRVGFGCSGRMALVGLSYYGGPLCGFGCLLFFEKADSGWKKTSQHGFWVS